LVGQTSGKRTVEALKEFWRSHSVTIGKKAWTRDDLHNRR
jgi:hypothetical protein